MGSPDILLPARDPTDHPPLPQVDNLGGPVQATPEVWTVVWQGSEDLGAQVTTFVAWMLQSSYWTSTLAEYGVGAGVSKGLLVIQQPAPAKLDDSDLQVLLLNLIGHSVASAPAFPVPNGNSQFIFLLPKGTMSTASGDFGCHGGGYVGYHSSAIAMVGGASMPVAYSVDLQCMADPGTYFDELTRVISHEVAEAASDPQPDSKPAFRSLQLSGVPGVGGGEIGDLCNGLGLPVAVDGANPPTSYWVQRQYSSAAAKAGVSDPCVPAPNHPYFNVAVSPAALSLTLPKPAKSTRLTAKIEPYSFGNAGEIKWVLAGLGQGITAYPASGSAHAGDTLLLVLNLDATAKAGLYPILIESQAQAGGTNFWFSSLTLK
jgi:hypothetical protein